MILKACAKINLLLSVGKKQENGLHEMDMIIQSVDLADIISIERASEMTLVIAGAELEAGPGNTAYDAAKAFFDASGIRCGAKINLQKNIPMMAGLGGGSADAAAVLTGLNQLYAKPLNKLELAAIAKRIGSDVPFFLNGGCARVRGTGEKLSPFINGLDCWYLILKPAQGISTREAFRRYDEHAWPPALDTEKCRTAIAEGKIADFERYSHNSFERAGIEICPQVGEILAYLRKCAKAAFMTGSGSACVGLFRSEAKARAAMKQAPADFAWVCRATREAVIMDDKMSFRLS